MADRLDGGGSGSKELSPEEYVTTLYRTMLGREPDDQGLIAHCEALRGHGDHTRILQGFLESPEFRDRGGREGALEALVAVSPEEDAEVSDPLDNKMVIECSWGHFDDLNFLELIGKRSTLYGRHKRKVRTIAVYYPKMSNGGTERVTSRQVLAWTELGYRVILLTDVPRDPKNDYFYGDVERFLLPPKMMHNHDYRTRGRILSSILIEQGVDVFVNNLWDEVSTVWDVLVAKSLGIPVVVGWHNVFDTRIRNADDLRLANVRFAGYKYADLVTTLSTVDKLWFRDRGVAARVVYNPLTFDHLPERTAPLDGRTVVWVARAERHQKRLDLAIRMFPLVLARVPDATLLIVGGGPDLEWAKEYARSLGIASHVRFTGYTTDVAQHLAHSDVHILTSEFEGWCLALGEAWAFGIPTVMFDLPYLEYVQSGRGHIAVEMGDIAAMADAVADLLLDETTRKRLGREAREVIEEFDTVSVKEEWRRIFDDIGTRDDLDTPLRPEQELRGLKALTTVLADRFLYLGADRSDRFLPTLPSDMPARPPERKTTRRLLTAGRMVAAPYVAAKRSVGRLVAPDRRLRMIDLSHVGLGDNIMIWTGLFTLLNDGVDLCAPGCLLHVQPVLAELASRLFARFGLVIQRGRPEREISPIYTPLPPAGLGQWWRTYAGHDWRMNWVEALDQQKTFPRHGSDLSFRARVRLALSERFLYRRRGGWAEATPGYVGYRVWAPVALEHGIYPLMFLSRIKQSLPAMRQIVAGFVDGMTPEAEQGRWAGNAAFPTGKSFQTIPPKVYAEVDAQLGPDFFTCYVQRDSPWFVDYETQAVNPTSLDDVNDTFRIIRYASKLLTTDSFTSHVAQLLRDDFTLVLSRDMKESIVHPGANPRIVANHPPCAPCNYQERYHFDRCVAGYRYCLAFENERFVREIADSLR